MATSISPLERSTLFLETDFFDVRAQVKLDNPIVYSGPLDPYLDYVEGELGWRTLDFDLQVLDENDFQGTSVMNYSDIDVPYMRIQEFKHLHPERRNTSGMTGIMKDFSRFSGRGDEPYNQINSVEDREALRRYRERAKAERGVFFGGRLGSHQYFDIHMAIASTLTLWENQT